MSEGRAWVRALLAVGLPASLVTGLGAGLLQISANHYVAQGFDWLALLMLRRILNTSIVLFAVAALLALGAIQTAALLFTGRRAARSEGASPHRRALDVGSAPIRGGLDAGPARIPGAAADCRSARGLQAALALLALTAIMAAFLFFEFFPSLNAAVRTSAAVDAIQGLLGPAGDFLGTRAGKALIIVTGALSAGALLVVITMRLLGWGRGGAALDGLLAGGRARRTLEIAAVALLLLVVGINAAVLLGSAEAAGAPNIILISLETVRADHLEAWGYERPTAPELAALARRGVLYANAIAQAPWTLPSMASVHTGLYLSGHGASGHKSKLGERFATLAEHLAEARYKTMAVVSWPFVTRTHGFDQGFALFDQDMIADDGSEVLAPEVTRRALGMIDSAEEAPFFLWLHYVEPHGAYVDHEEVDFASGYQGRLPRVVDLEALYEIKEGLQESDVRYIRDIYDEEITVLDRSLGELLGGLEKRGLDRKTVIVALGDHGEEFLERGQFGHARHLYQELIHVPLVIVDPRDPALAGVRVEQPVELRSVAHTILMLAGISGRGLGTAGLPGGPGPRDGGDPAGASATRDRRAGGFRAGAGSDSTIRAEAPVDLLDLARGRVTPGPAFSEYVDQWGMYSARKAVLEGRYKMIRNADGGTADVYDLASDPGERRNLLTTDRTHGGEGPHDEAVARDAAAVGQAAARLVRALDAFASTGSRPGDEAILSEEEIERLRTLGYIR